ncbi:hypothetical protein [Acinetobacter sp. ANC 4173]|uniref:hypothetical protein n=1 Tax=Acinetobacter sp. ANC 4173 TaxID=2529837 RepID=UPI00103A62BF|nr:hypothetical protein [Acinetobacter sp. ANC 4173]TCB75608.1 hypothetical protein E0H94_16680 [Acinetobacter sp. ANC 4173]
MKNKVQCLAALWFAVSCGSAFASVEDYVVTVDKINRNYKADIRQFFSQLNPQQTSFTAEQQTRYCGIMGRYVEQLYIAADKNRSSLDAQYRNLTKQDVIQQVMSSKEMMILRKYNVQCNLT